MASTPVAGKISDQILNSVLTMPPPGARSRANLTGTGRSGANLAEYSAGLRLISHSQGGLTCVFLSWMTSS